MVVNGLDLGLGLCGVVVWFTCVVAKVGWAYMICVGIWRSWRGELQWKFQSPMESLTPLFKFPEQSWFFVLFQFFHAVLQNLLKMSSYALWI